MVSTLASAGVGGRSPFPSFSFSFLCSSLLLLSLPAFYPGLVYPSCSVGIPPLCSSNFLFLAMNIVEIVCRAPALSPTQVFSTPPPFPGYLPLPAALFVGIHELHPDSWLPSFRCWLSFLCGCAREADRNSMMRLKRRYSVVDEDLDGSRFTVATMDAVDGSRIYNFVCVFGLQ